MQTGKENLGLGWGSDTTYIIENSRIQHHKTSITNANQKKKKGYVI